MMFKKISFFSSNFKISSCAALGFLVVSATFSTISAASKSTNFKNTLSFSNLEAGIKAISENITKSFTNIKETSTQWWTAIDPINTTNQGIQKFKDFLNNSETSISSYFETLKTHLTTGWSYISSASSSVYNFLSNYITTENIKKIPSWISTGFEWVSSNFKTAASWVWSSITDFSWIKDIPEKFEEIKKYFSSSDKKFSFETIKEWGKTIYRVTTKIIYPWVKTSFKLIGQGEDFSELWKYIKNWENFKTLFSEISKFTKNNISELESMDEEDKKTILKEFLKSPENFVEKLKILNKPAEKGQGTVKKNIKDQLLKTKNQLEQEQNASNVGNLISGGVKGVASIAGSVVSGVINGILGNTEKENGEKGSGVGKIFEEGAEIVSDITSPVIDLFSSFFSF